MIAQKNRMNQKQQYKNPQKLWLILGFCFCGGMDVKAESISELTHVATYKSRQNNSKNRAIA